MVADDPAVAAVQAEMEKALPFIKGAKDGLESVVGGPVGADTVLLALFIVFCGRGLLTMGDKILTFWLEERRAHRLERERLAEEARASGRARAALAIENAASGLRSGVIRPAGWPAKT